MTRVPDLRAAKAEFRSYLADKSRYVSITELQGPLRHGEPQLGARRRWYIKQTMQWDAEGLCWRNKDGRPLIVKDLIWDTVIFEMRQLDTHGQRLVWTTVKAKYDGILEDDVRTICKVWYKHGLSQLNRSDESQWTRYGDNVELAAPSGTPSSTKRSQSSDTLRDDESTQDDKTSSDDESSHDDESHDDDEPFHNDDDPTQEDQPSEANDSSRDDENDELFHADDDPTQEDQSSQANDFSQDEESQDEDLGHQMLKCVLIPKRTPIIEKKPPKRRRANSIEMLQSYTKRLEEKEAKRPSRRAKMDIDGLRGIGTGIYASNAIPFAQEAAERMARSKALAEYVDNASPEAPKGRQGTAPKKRLRTRSPSSTPAADDDESDNDDSSDDDEDEGDWERVRPDPELDAKHIRLLKAMGHNIGQQAAHGPMYA